MVASNMFKCLEDLDRTGVYIIKNVLDGNVYVGSTNRSFKHRFGNHLSTLKMNKNRNKNLQSSWNNNESDVFLFSVIEYVDDMRLVGEREQYWIDYYRDNGVCLYNIDDVRLCRFTNMDHKRIVYITKAITISDEHQNWIDEHSINLSRFVQIKIDEEIKNSGGE